jgi:hypothetical protein
LLDRCGALKGTHDWVMVRLTGPGRDPSGVGLMVAADHPDRGLRRLPDEYRQAGVTEAVVPPHGRPPREVADAAAAIPELAE